MKMNLRSAGRHLWTSWIKPLALSAAIVFPLKSAVADWNWVPSGSMRPTILEGELVFVNKLAYDLKVPFTTHRLALWGDPQRGDIVVCFSPADGKRLVKRVIGLPGDRITVRGAQLRVNGAAVSYAAPDERWLRHLTVAEKRYGAVATESLGSAEHAVLATTSSSARLPDREYVVPAGDYFMMGDNRDRSFDSRFFGSISRKEIVGRASAVVLSFDPERALLPRFDRCFNELL